MTKQKTLLKKIIYTLFAIIIFQTSGLAKDIYEITAKKITYNDNKNIVVAEGNALATNSLGKKVSSDKIVYDKNKNLIETFGSSKFEDGNNILTADNFKYDIEIKTIEAIKNVVLIDVEKNKYLFSFFKYLENEQRGFGENMKAYLNDGSYIESKSGYTNSKTEITKLNQAKYTTCSNIFDKNNKFCPTWSMKSSSTTHDKNKKRIIHKNAFLKIKNVPILYAPYFSHPDPTVKRQSGFLPPLIKTVSNLGRTFKTPYFWAIDDDKDLTISPIYYFDEKNTVLTSYRQAFQNGFLNIESGYSGGYKRLNKEGRTKGSRNYLFANFNGIKENIFFKNNEINFKIERISQENFVRVNKFNTPLFKEDIRSLENSIKISSYNLGHRLELRAGVFENLDISDSSKYTYYLPDGVYSYNTNKIKNFNTNFNSYFLGSKFQKNQKKFKFRNLISLQSKAFTSARTGISNTLKVNFLNRNVFNRNVVNEKENENIDNNLTIAIDNNYPLAKFSKDSYQTLTPRFFAKYTTGNMVNAKNQGKVFNFSDAFSMNRTGNLDTPETGASYGYGIEHAYKKNKPTVKDNNSLFTTKTGIAQVIRTSRLDNMPVQSSLNNKTSDFAGYINLGLSDHNELTKKSKGLSVNYDFNLGNDLKKLNRNSLGINGNYSKFYGGIRFEEKNNHIGNERSINYNFKNQFSDDYNIAFNGKKNLQNDNSEYHNLSLNFENDCLMTSLILSREFYSDKDLGSNKSLIFSITIKPFSDSIAPDLTSFIN